MSKYIKELQRRIPVWQSISGLYLDNEIDDATIDYIIREYLQSKYTLEELDYIYRYEVTPVLWFNTIGGFGEWAAFDADELAESILKYTNGSLEINQKKISLFSKLRNHYRLWRVKHDWQRVLNKLNAKNN